MQRSKFRIASHQVMNEERTVAKGLLESLVAELRPDTKHDMWDVVGLRYQGDCIQSFHCASPAQPQEGWPSC
jgi:hypothetical protein